MSNVDTFSDQQLLVMALMRQTGASRAEAEQVLAYDPASTERLRPFIERERQHIADELASADQRDFEASPAGKTEAAKAALAAQAERAELVAGAKLLLSEQGLPVDSMDDAEALHHSGIEKRPELLTQQEKDEGQLALADKWASLDDATKREQAAFYGTTTAAMDKYVGFFVSGAEGEVSE